MVESFGSKQPQFAFLDTQQSSCCWPNISLLEDSYWELSQVLQILTSADYLESNSALDPGNYQWVPVANKTHSSLSQSSTD